MPFIWKSRIPQAKGAIIDAATRIVDKGGSDVRDIARVEAPYDTGLLSGSIEWEMEGEYTDRPHGQVYTVVEYAIYQEYGTRFHGAHPFMGPAADRVRPKYLAAWRTLERDIAQARREGLVR